MCDFVDANVDDDYDCEQDYDYDCEQVFCVTVDANVDDDLDDSDTAREASIKQSHVRKDDKMAAKCRSFK